MSGGQLTVPMVLRTQGGAGQRGAAQHSQSLESWLTHVPGPQGGDAEPSGRRRGAARSGDRRPQSRRVHREQDAVLPQGRGARAGAGPCRSARPRRCARAATSRSSRSRASSTTRSPRPDSLAAETAIEAEVIDPRTLVPLDLDDDRARRSSGPAGSSSRTRRSSTAASAPRSRRRCRRPRSTTSTRRSRASARRSRRSRSARRSRTPTCRARTRVVAATELARRSLPVSLSREPPVYRSSLPRRRSRSARRRSTSSASTGSRRCSRIPARRRSTSSPTCRTTSASCSASTRARSSGMATGWAIGRGEPALAILHTTAGLGNAVGALATARVNRAPLVVVVGQQDRRHLASEPFLAGKLRGLAGEYPVWVERAAASAGRARSGRPRLPRGGDRARARARDRADGRLVGRGGRAGERAAPSRVVRGARRGPGAVARARGAPRRRARARRSSSAPAPTSPTRGARSSTLAERLVCPVWQESFGARAGFPQDHPLFAGHLPADRPRLRQTLAPYDAVLVVGGPAFRQYPYVSGPFVEPGTRVAVVSEDPAEVHRSAAELAVLAHPAAVCARARRHRARARRRAPGAVPQRPRRPRRPGPVSRSRAGPRLRRHGGAAAAERDRDRGVARRTGPSCSTACPRASRSAP